MCPTHSAPGQCERALGVRARSLDAYLKPDETALGRSRGMYRVPLFCNMSRILVADLGKSR